MSTGPSKSYNGMTREQAKEIAEGLRGKYSRPPIPNDVYEFLPPVVCGDICSDLYVKGLVPHMNRELKRLLVMLNEGQLEGLEDVILGIYKLAKSVI